MLLLTDNTKPDTPHCRPVCSLGAMIGSTPLLEIHYTIDGSPRRIFAKYEQKSMTGSVKDRMAEWILDQAQQSGSLRPGDTITEATSGNTGISFAALGRALGYPVRIYMPDWMSRERVTLIESFGAQIIGISREQGGFIGAIKMAEQYAREHEQVFLPRQFDNWANVQAHEATTGPEIHRQLETLGLVADAVIAGVGTGGTIMGLSRYLRTVNPDLKSHPLEPANSPTLSTGHKIGKHRIQGISDEFVPPIVHLDELDDIVEAWDGDSILMAQALCRELGLAVGISSGANILGAIQVADKMGIDATVVTVLPDSNKKYLSTDLCHHEPVQSKYISPRVVLKQFTAIACPPASQNCP